ncbi:MAG: YihY/virulence factor BrkB family protein [Bacteroidales bacterium]|nr:YihY/virulence factor BrkB family protein [Bacteroidales bacterium]
MLSSIRHKEKKGIEKLTRKVRTVLESFSLPGFQGISVFYVVMFFIRGFQTGTLVTRASSIAFNFLLASLPTFIFLFTLIPFIPIPNFQTELMTIFENVLPSNAFSLLESTLVEVITQRSGGLLFFMFLTTIIFSTNGIHAVINAFNVSIHDFKIRSWISQRITSFLLLFIIIIMITSAILIILIGKVALNKFVELNLLQMNFTFYLLSIAKWVVFISLVFFSISILYYQIPAEKKEWKFFSPGSIVATLLFVISSLGFSFYVNNFGQYNKLYGSIGTLIVILLWMYFNSISLLLGFELNASIITANKKKGLLPQKRTEAN